MMLENLLKYTAIADRKVIEVFKINPDYGDRALFLFSHVLNAQHIWASRIVYTVPLYERMQIHSIDQLDTISEKNTADLKHIFDTLHLSHQIHYSNSDGSKFDNTVEEILFHVINHSTYHRGQIATQLKQNGINPPVTDFIILNRLAEL